MAGRVWCVSAKTGAWYGGLTRALWLLTRIDGSLPLRRPDFVLGHVGDVYTVASVSIRVSAGIEIRF